jgi:hypothetical protein
MSDNDSQTDEPVRTKDRQERDPDRWFLRPMDKFRRVSRALDFKPNPAFFELADPVMKSQRTLLGYDRLYVLWQVVRNVADIPGSVAEVGSFRGGSAHFIASALASLAGGEVPMHVFDTFEGHPEKAITDKDPFHVPGQFSETSADDVRAYLSAFTTLQIHQGDVADSLPRLDESAYRLVHIDTDLYKPTILCLEYFGDRLSTGGVIVVDDYGQKKCPGVPKAVSEYLERHQGFQAWDMRTEQLALVKR